VEELDSVGQRGGARAPYRKKNGGGESSSPMKNRVALRTGDLRAREEWSEAQRLRKWRRRRGARDSPARRRL
jgi:hypothetical protein